MNNIINYLDFYSYKSLIADKNMSNKLVKTYQHIFGDPLLWGENYSQHEVQNKLRDELSGNASLRLCINSSNNSELLGFCWAQQLHLHGVENAIQSIQYYKALGRPDIRDTLKQILNDEPVIYLHDLGIAAPYRGLVPLQQLICPVLNSLSIRSQTQRLFFWSIKDSRIFRLAEYAGFKLAATVNGMQFFIGNINSKRIRTVCK